MCIIGDMKRVQALSAVCILEAYYPGKRVKHFSTGKTFPATFPGAGNQDSRDAVFAVSVGSELAGDLKIFRSIEQVRNLTRKEEA